MSVEDWIERTDGTVMRRQPEYPPILSFAPPRFRHVQRTDLDESATEAAGRWMDADAVGNLLIGGPVGVGKTHTAIAIAAIWKAATRSDEVIFAPTVELLDNLRPGADPTTQHDWGGMWREVSWMEAYCQCPLLVLDDLGGEKPTDWTAERLYLLVNYRWLHNSPIIATTNLTPEELQPQIGERTYDRLRDGAIGLRLSGESRRKPAHG